MWASTAPLAQGDVVATGGRWWAVWREHVAPGGGPGDEFDQTELFQAYTVGGTYVPRERITTNSSWDSAPALALTPATTFPVRLVWARGGSDFEAAESDLRRALGDAGGGWISTTLATAGFLNFWPDVQMLGDDDLCHLEPGRPHRAGQQRHRVVPEQDLRDPGRPEPPAPDRGRAGPRGGRLDHHVGAVRGVRGRAGRHHLDGRAASPAGVTRLQLLQGVAATGGTATATILSLGSRLYAATET